jgi:hypothetical protein
MGFVLLPLFIVGIIIVLPFWKIFTKAGFPGPLSILMLIPFVQILMIFFLAFAEWPTLKGGSGGIEQPPAA